MTEQSCNGYEYAYHGRSNMESDEVTEEGMSPSGVKSVFLGAMRRNYLAKKGLDIWVSMKDGDLGDHWFRVHQG